MCKKFLIAFLCGLMVFGSACGGGSAVSSSADIISSETAEKDLVEDASVDNIETNITAEDFDKFASGTVSGETQTEESIASPDFAIDGAIYEKCPSKATTRQLGVGYGKFKHETYYSETCGMDRGFNILLPSDYDAACEYPVLYLLHGIFGDENSMTDSSNKVVEMVANLASQGIIEETIVVCPNMFAKDDPSIQPGFTAEQCLPYDNFINDLVNDLMPYIESNYSVKTGRENTMLAGFSMGGRETIYITLQRPELFGYVCAIAPAPGVTPAKDNFMEHPGQMSEDEFKFAEGAVEPDVFIITAGDRDSVVGKFPKGYHELFDTNGVDHIWYEIAGADHDTNAIKSGLFNLFMQTAYSKSNNR